MYYIKIWIKMIGGIILSNSICFFIFSSMIFLSNNIIYLIFIQIIFLLLTIFFIYIPVWNIGNKDRIRDKNSNKTFDKYAWLKMNFIISFPFIFSFILLIFSKLNIIPNILVFYKLINSNIIPIIHYILPYSSDIKIFSSTHLFILGSLTLIYTPIVYLAYKFGYKGIFILDKIIYKDN